MKTWKGAMMGVGEQQQLVEISMGGVALEYSHSLALSRDYEAATSSNGAHEGSGDGWDAA